MSKITRKLPSADVVAASSTATFRFPIGGTYEKGLFTYGGTTFDLTHMTEIRIVGNGRVIDRFAATPTLSGGQVLDKLNQFEGRAAANGVLAIDFGRYGLRTRIAEEMTGLGTGIKPVAPGQTGYDEYKKAGGTGVELSTLQVEFDIKSTAVAPTLTAKAHLSPARPLGMIKKIRRFGYDPAGAGEYEIADLPRGDLINKIVFHSSQINAVKLELDSQVKFDRTPAENNLVQADGKRVPQAGMFVIDPTEEGYGAEPFVTMGVQDMRFTLDMAAADSVKVDVEYIGPMEA